MADKLTSNIRRTESWRRVLLVLLFGAIYWVASWLLGAVVLLQAGWLLASGAGNVRLACFGASLADYLRRVARFLTGATDHLPFPFSEWESAPPPGNPPPEPRDSVLGEPKSP